MLMVSFSQIHKFFEMPTSNKKICGKTKIIY